MDEVESKRRVAVLLREQAAGCGRLGSELYARLLEDAAGDVEAGGPAWRVLEDCAHDPPEEALALRFMGALHRIVLEGGAPRLAAYYPSVGGRAHQRGAWEAFRETLEEQRERLRLEMRAPVQTNEVGRCAALVGGFLLVAGHTGLPLRVLEIGASAGLNLNWHLYRYEARGASWGDSTSPVRLCSYNSPPKPPFHVAAEVIDRRGCDARPLDARSAAGRLALTSFVWPDQVARLRLLRSALEVFQRFPVAVQAAGAAAWVGEALSTAHSGVATVVFHSIVLQYLDQEERDELITAIEAAGRRATEAAPLAWLRMEPAGELTDVRLRLWPGGRDRLVARAGYHGDPVIWLA